MTALVIESSREMSDITRAVLQSFGITGSYSAVGGENAFEVFCRLNPDLMIIDWLEAPYSGPELTRQIRTNPKSINPFVPVILATGYTHRRRVETARDAGITEFLAKPFTAKALYQKIERIIENPRRFVVDQSYIGPDRRHKPGEKPYAGQDRRNRSQPEEEKQRKS